MRDLVLYAHIILGLVSIGLAIYILTNLKNKSIKTIAIVNALINWLIILPAGYLYLVFYPATKTVIKAGSSPWAHTVIMETKEHWGLLVPIIATVAAMLVLTNNAEKSKKWWWMLIIVIVLIGILGRIVKMGAY